MKPWVCPSLVGVWARVFPELSPIITIMLWEAVLVSSIDILVPARIIPVLNNGVVEVASIGGRAGSLGKGRYSILF